ncbi:MAG: hypothetical protein JSU89_03480 [Myxococcales bacterium]|nr:MAG: hypothetical protein JSU89_03480 [Myxococcales bacterium]
MTAIDFQEEQRISMWWVWLAVFVPAGIMVNIFVEQIVFCRPHGEHPGPDWLVWVLTVILCACVPALLWVLRLTVTISDEGVHVRYYPFVNRMIPFSDIRAFRARRYRPIREFGGWGIRTGLGKKSAYNTKGDLGVELYLRNGRSIMIGSQRHEELAAAIRKRGVSEDPNAQPPRGHWH